MSISSMTGFARADGQDGACAWTWETKSVNSRGLDLRCRLPSGFDHLEPAVRDRAQKLFRRGNVTVSLNLTWARGDSGYKVNHVVLGELLATLPEIRKQVPKAGTPSIDGLLNLRGVIEPVDERLGTEAQEALDARLLDDLDRTLGALAEMRADEGLRLVPTLSGQLAEIRRLVDDADALAAAQPDTIRARLKAQVSALVDDVAAIPEDRLAQEAAILMTKADLREELDRLSAHHQAAEELLGGGGAVGRKLDFLCQEFNREANTLCSKAQDVELTAVGLALKAVAEQFREQVQNIE